MPTEQTTGPAASTDVATVDDDALTPELAAYVADMEAVQVSDPEEVQRAILNRILTATSLDEVLGRQQIDHARDVLGVPLRVLGVRWMRSDFEGSVGTYAVIDVVRGDTGEHTAVTCGAAGVMGQLYKVAQFKAFPVDVVLTESDRPTANGYRPMWLELVAPPASPAHRAATPGSWWGLHEQTPTRSGDEPF